MPPLTPASCGGPVVPGGSCPSTTSPSVPGAAIGARPLPCRARARVPLMLDCGLAKRLVTGLYILGTSTWVLYSKWCVGCGMVCGLCVVHRGGGSCPPTQFPPTIMHKLVQKKPPSSPPLTPTPTRPLHTCTNALKNTISLINGLSSNVMRTAPSGVPPLPPRRAFLMLPRIPETVRTDAPSNFAASSWVVNMPLMNAVFL